jgi:hypothetical protein
MDVNELTSYECSSEEKRTKTSVIDPLFHICQKEKITQEAASVNGIVWYSGCEIFLLKKSFFGYDNWSKKVQFQ